MLCTKFADYNSTVTLRWDPPTGGVEREKITGIHENGGRVFRNSHSEWGVAFDTSLVNVWVHFERKGCVDVRQPMREKESERGVREECNTVCSQWALLSLFELLFFEIILQ